MKIVLKRMLRTAAFLGIVVQAAGQPWKPVAEMPMQPNPLSIKTGKKVQAFNLFYTR